VKHRLKPRRLFLPSKSSTPIQVVRRKPISGKTTMVSLKSSVIRHRKKSIKRRSFKRFDLDKFSEENGPILGRYLLEFCRMKILKRKLKSMRYTPYQKWMAANLMVGATVNGYRMLSRLIPLPSPTTVLRSLEVFKTKAGITKRNIDLLKLKVNTDNKENKPVFIIIDEMSLRTGLKYDQKSGSIYGYQDDGTTRKRTLANSAFCFMVCGIVKKFKYPIGYIFTSSTMKSDDIIKYLTEAIKSVEGAGFSVKGVTSDQGPNMQKAFKSIGVNEENPFFLIDNNKYYVLRDPPHLLKNARNFLETKDVYVPGHAGKASWMHIKQLHELDQVSSLKKIPKVTDVMISGLKFGSRMKVKFATNVLSHSVSAALLDLVAENQMPSTALATSCYCQMFNDLFDLMNAISPNDKVKLRRPLHGGNKSTSAFMEEANAWLLKLKRNNDKRKNSFISGFIQNLKVLKALNEELTVAGFPYLSTRNINQDCLELFFGKVRNVAKYPTAGDFAHIYARLTVASLIRAPTTSNCENIDECNGAINFMTYVSMTCI